mgnify:CR=1 FL=1
MKICNHFICHFIFIVLHNITTKFNILHFILIMYHRKKRQKKHIIQTFNKVTKKYSYIEQ